MQLRALLYADSRAFVNGARRAIRSPGRIAIWIVYALLLVGFFLSRFFLRGHARAASGYGDVARADYFMCALLVTLALSLTSGWGSVGIFRSRAEARFIIGSPVAAPVAIAYLQAREALAQGVRLLLSFIYLIFIFGPRRIGPIAVIADIALVLAIVTAAAAVAIPRRLLARPAGIACAVVGLALALLALAPAVRDALEALPFPFPQPIVVRILRWLPAWHPGRVLLEPDLLWLLAVLAIAAGAIAMLAATGRDAYPELYGLSIARIDRLERWRRRRDTLAAAPPPMRRTSATIGPVPAGVLVFVWKSIVEFRRQTQRQYIAGGAALWCVAGFAVARFLATDDGALFATLTGVVVNIMLVAGIDATNAIAGEVRRPLFWLARAALFERLCALALARIWRRIVTLELIAASFALGGGRLLETLVVAVGLPALVALFAGVGFAAYGLFPSAADRRGPIVLLRLGVSAILLVPPLILWFIVATALRAPLTALATTALLALIEAGALIGVAAWRLDGHLDRLAA